MDTLTTNPTDEQPLPEDRYVNLRDLIGSLENHKPVKRDPLEYKLRRDFILQNMTLIHHLLDEVDADCESSIYQRVQAIAIHRRQFIADGVKAVLDAEEEEAARREDHEKNHTPHRHDENFEGRAA